MNYWISPLCLADPTIIEKLSHNPLLMSQHNLRDYCDSTMALLDTMWNNGPSRPEQLFLGQNKSNPTWYILGNSKKFLYETPYPSLAWRKLILTISNLLFVKALMFPLKLTYLLIFLWWRLLSSEQRLGHFWIEDDVETAA